MLKLNHITKTYDDFILQCSLEVKPGCVTGLIGKNGAGKSTLFKSALGLIHIDDGNIELFGKNAGNITNEDKQKIGVALSDSGFSSYLTIEDISCVLKNMYHAYDEEVFLAQCRKFDLPLKKKIKEFSTGMKAKLKLLVAMSHDASLLILDEPTVGLDVMAREQLLDMLRGYMEEDDTRSLLISSHISSDLEHLCDDFYLIDNGKILLHEETDRLLSDYALIKLDEAQYHTLDRQYILKSKKESFGYCLLTDQKQFYQENYPEIVVEKGNIDDLIVMMIGGAQ